VSEAASQPDHTWATHDDPDLLLLQLAPVPTIAGGEPVDVLRALLVRRGFGPLAPGEEVDLRPANGCLLQPAAAGGAELLLVVGEAGATRIALPDLDPAWWERAVAAGQAAVLVVRTAVLPDGTTTRDDLRRDVDAGVVIAALVPAAGR
jgi:hypothetical protein